MTWYNYFCWPGILGFGLVQQIRDGDYLIYSPGYDIKKPDKYAVLSVFYYFVTDKSYKWLVSLHWVNSFSKFTFVSEFALSRVY